jgi:spore coat protein H
MGSSNGMVFRAAVLIALALGACSDGAAPAHSAAAPGRGRDAGRLEGADAGGASDDAYPDRVLQVELTVDPADWDKLRAEGRTINRVLSGCLDPSFAYTLVPAELRIDGKTLGQIGLRKKGFIGSLSAARPSLHLDLGQYDPSVSFAGRKTLTLNNSKQDPSFTHQCMAFGLFARAGVPSSRCSFAHVRVNGEDLGIYVNVEPVKQPLLGRYFPMKDGNLYEGTSADLRADMLGGFESKNANPAADTSDLAAAASALEPTGATMYKAISTLVDLDEFMAFWAVESLISHWDGYSGDLNNFFVYHDPATDRLAFIPWGPDAAFVRHHGFLPDAGRPVSVLAWARLPDRLYAYPVTRDQYRARMRELLDSTWHEDELLAEVDHIEKLLGGAASAAGLAAQRDFIRTRRAEVQAELDGPAPSWTFAERPAAQCGPDMSTVVRGTFQTTWGKLASPAASAGQTLEVQIDGTPQTFIAVLSGAGPSDSSTAAQAEGSVLRLIGARADKTFVLLQLTLGPRPLAPGTLPLHGLETYGAVLQGSSASDATLVGLMGEGSVTFDAASMHDGDAVRGHFEGKLLRTKLGAGALPP